MPSCLSAGHLLRAQSPQSVQMQPISILSFFMSLVLRKEHHLFILPLLLFFISSFCYLLCVPTAFSLLVEKNDGLQATPTGARLALGEDFLSRKRKGVCVLCRWNSHRRGWFHCLFLKSACNSSPSWLLAHQLIHFEKSIPLYVTGKIILFIL